MSSTSYTPNQPAAHTPAPELYSDEVGQRNKNGIILFSFSGCDTHYTIRRPVRCARQSPRSLWKFERRRGSSRKGRKVACLLWCRVKRHLKGGWETENSTQSSSFVSFRVSYRSIYRIPQILMTTSFATIVERLCGILACEWLYLGLRGEVYITKLSVCGIAPTSSVRPVSKSGFEWNSKNVLEIIMNPSFPVWHVANR